MKINTVITVFVVILFIITYLFKSILPYSILYSCAFIYTITIISKLKNNNTKCRLLILCCLSFILCDTFIIPLSLIYNAYKIIYVDKKLYKHLAYNLFSDIKISISNNFDKLPKKPSILVLNYPDDVFEYFINGILPVNVCYVVAKKSKPFMNLFTSDDNIIYLNKKNNYESLSEKIIEKINHSHIFLYIEEWKKNTNGVGRIKTGVLSIAKNNNIPITPICVDKISHCYGITKKQTFYIKVGETQLVNNIYESKIHVRQFFRDTLKEFKTSSLIKF